MPAVLPLDLVFAARVLRKSRGFTIVAASSLALAIGANTTIFPSRKQLLFDRLDVPNAVILRLLATTDADFSYPVYEQLRAQNTVLGDLLAFHATAVERDGRRQRGARARCTKSRATTTRCSASSRRSAARFVRSDDSAGSDAVAMISDDFWNREFARSPAAIGQSIKINDVPVTIIGVNPKGFTGAGSTLPSETPAVIVTLAKATLVTPASNGRNWLADPAAGGLIVLARAKPGVSDQHGAGDARRAVRPRFSARSCRFAPAMPCRD